MIFYWKFTHSTFNIVSNRCNECYCCVFSNTHSDMNKNENRNQFYLKCNKKAFYSTF